MQDAVCAHCRRPIFRRGQDGIWRLVYIEYERTHLCDARDMDYGHEPAN